MVRVRVRVRVWVRVRVRIRIRVRVSGRVSLQHSKMKKISKCSTIHLQLSCVAPQGMFW